MKDEPLRVLRSKQQAQNNYNRISPIYNLLEGIWEKKAIYSALNMLNVSPGEKVLEIGFGPGNALVKLAGSVGGSGKVYGIDLSEGMLEEANNRLTKQELNGRVELINGDAASLPYSDNSFDCIVSSFFLELIDSPEIPVVLNECKRTLKKGGRLCITSLSAEGKDTFMRDLYNWGHLKFPSLLDCRPIYTERELIECGFIIQNSTLTKLAGIPVEIILASK